MTFQDHIFAVTVAVTTLAALAILAATALRGWQGWLELKRAEMERFAVTPNALPVRLPAADRIEMADIKERIRKLEAIAAGVDV
ncbi:MAG: hypothetical protein ABW184_03380 [Sphingobium sp.]